MQVPGVEGSADKAAADDIIGKNLDQQPADPEREQAEPEDKIGGSGPETPPSSPVAKPAGGK